MEYGIEDLVRDVRVCLDQNGISDALVLADDQDTLTLDEIIRSKAVEGVARVHTDAPAHLLDSGHNFGDSIYWMDKESGYTLLPDDFMRLVVFEMDDWEQPVLHAITADDGAYALQRSRCKALRGTAQRPVVAIVARPAGKALEFYSCKSEDARVSRAVYMPYPRIDDNGFIDISERCYRGAVYMIAALTASTFGDGEKTQMLSELAKNALV